MAAPLEFIGTPETVSTKLAAGPVQAPPTQPLPTVSELPPLPEEVPAPAVDVSHLPDLPPDVSHLPDLPSDVSHLPDLPSDVSHLPDLPEIGAMGAFAQGAFDAGTFSFGDEIQGGLDWLLDKAAGTSAKNLELAKAGFKGDLGPTTGAGAYRQGVEAARAKLVAAREQHPMATLAGTVLGAIAVPGISGLAAAKGLGTAGKIAVGASEGALGGLGFTEAKLLPDEMSLSEMTQAAKDIGVGMALGGVATGLLVGAGKAFKGFSKKPLTVDQAAEAAKNSSELLDYELSQVRANAHEIETLGSLAVNRDLAASGDELSDFRKTMKAIGTDIPDRISGEADAALEKLKPGFIKKQLEKSERKAAEMQASAAALPKIEHALEIDPEPIVRLSNVIAEADPLGPMIKKLANKGISVDPEELAAFIAIKKDKQAYLNFLAPRTIHNSQLESGMIKNVDYTELERGLRTQGKITKQSYQEFRLQKYRLEFAEAKVVNIMGAADPTSSLSYFENMRSASRMIDDKAATGLETYVVNLEHSVHEHHDFVITWHNIFKPIYKSGRKVGMSGEEITAALESPEIRATLSPDKLDVVTKYQGVFEDFRQAGIAKGLDIGKLENYVPHAAKRGVDLITAIRGRINQLGGASLTKVDDITADRVFHLKGDYNLEDIIAAAPETRALAEYKMVLARMFGVDIVDMVSLRKYSAALLDNSQAASISKKSLGYEAAAAFARQGSIPDFIREKDIERLFNNMSVNTSKAAHLSLPLKYIEAHIPVLDALGMKDSAKYITKYIADMSGQSSRKLGKLQDMGMQYQLWAQDLGGLSGKMAQAVPEVFGFLGQQIYPNLLAWNPANLLPNLAQPFTMGATSMATGGGNIGQIAYGHRKALLAAVDVAKEIRLGHPRSMMKKIEATLAKEGFTTPEMIDRDFINMSEEMRHGKTAEALDKYRQFMSVGMLLFNYTDKISKYTAIKMSDRVSQDFLSATAKKGSGLIKDEARSLAVVAGLPSSLRTRLKYATPAEAKQLFRLHFVAETNLIYGKVGATEFARDFGPVASMLSTWPTTVTSDIVGKFRTLGGAKGLKVVTEKYLGPAFALAGLGFALTPTDPKNKDRMKVLVGGGGIKGLSPIYSIKGIGTLGHTPITDTAISVVTGASGLLDIVGGDGKVGVNKISKAVGDSIKLYMPGYQIWNGAKRMERFRTGKKD